MIMEKSPLLEEIDWIEHGFFGRDTAVTNTTVGIQEKTPFANAPVFFLPQKHTDIIVSPDSPLPPEADASITDEPCVALALKTADCVPLLLVCTKTKMIAAVHAGWQGALNQISAKTVAQMVEKGAKANRIIAAMGPSIHERSMLVREDVRDKFRVAQPDTIGFFKTFRDQWLMDVGGIIQHQLHKAGVTKIDPSMTNTYTSANHYSFRRRDEDPDSETQRNVSYIMLKS